MNIREVLRPAVRGQAAQAGRKPAQTEAKVSFTPKRSTDRLTLSRQALDFVQEQNRLAWEEKPEQSSSSPLDSFAKEQKTQDKLLKIAARLRRGDRVPPEDEAYLMKHDPSFYVLAMAQRKENPHPKEWESLLSEEDLREMSEPDTGASEVHMSLPDVPGGE